MKKNISLFLFLFILMSCEKEEISNNQVDNSVFMNIAPSDDDFDANINIIANDLGAAPIHPNQIQIDAHFKNEEGNNILVNSFKVDNITPELQTENQTYLEYLHPTDDFYDAIKAKFGETIDLEVNSDNFPDFSITTALPEPVELISPTLNQTLSKNSTTLSWVAHENDLKIGIMIRYNSVLSKDIEGLPEQNIAVIKYLDDIDGEYTFTENELADFPQNSWVTVYVGRAEQDIIQQDGKKILFNGLYYQLVSDFKME